MLAPYEIDFAIDIKLPNTSHKLYCDINIIKEMLSASSPFAAQEVLDTRIANIISVDWDPSQFKM